MGMREKILIVSVILLCNSIWIFVGFKFGQKYANCSFQHGKTVGRMEVIREMKSELAKDRIPEVLK
jgi:hypothetical protein